jgi:hypothetical protein
MDDATLQKIIDTASEIRNRQMHIASL